jgi:hypothetical protein
MQIEETYGDERSPLPGRAHCGVQPWMIRKSSICFIYFDLPLGSMEWTNEGSAADQMKCILHTVVYGRFEVCRIGQGRFVAIRM